MWVGSVLSHIRSKKVAKSWRWVHQSFSELRFIIKESNFLTRVERHALVDRVIKTFRKEKDFNEFFSRDIIERMAIPTGKYWAICLIDLEYNPFIL